MYLSKVKIYSIQIQVFCNLKKIELSISWALAPKKINYIYQLLTQTAVPMALKWYNRSEVPSLANIICTSLFWWGEERGG